MNEVERALSEDLTRLMDRLAGSIPQGAVARVLAHRPTRARLEQLDAELAAAQASLGDAYGRWRRALDDLESLWAVAAWRALDEPATVPPLAA